MQKKKKKWFQFLLEGLIAVCLFCVLGSLLYNLVSIFIALLLYKSVLCDWMWISIFLRVLWAWKFEFRSQKYLRENSFYSLDEYSECQIKFWHMIWIDIRGLWYTCSFSLLTSLYYKYVSMYPATICNKGKFPT